MKISELKNRLRFQTSITSALTGALEEEKEKAKAKAEEAFDAGIKVGLTSVAITAGLIAFNSFILDRLDKWAKDQKAKAVDGDEKINGDNDGIPYIRH